MPTDEELRRMDLEAAFARLGDFQDGLEALCENPEIANHAAEEYLDVAIDMVEAARDDVEHGIAELEHDAD